MNGFIFLAQRSANVFMSEAEGQAPEQTPLSYDLCARLGVPQGTRWGPPSGQGLRGRKEETAPPQNLAKSTSSLPDDANKHSKTIEV